MHKFDAWLLGTGRRLHGFLVAQGFYPAAFSTLLCFGLWGARVYLSKGWTFYFLLWNLFLAWIPYLCSLWATSLHHRHPRRWWLLLLPGVIGIAFFPNAPYIITDFLHLRERAPIPLWYDIGMLTSFAWTGVVVGVYALRLMQNIVQVWFGRILGWGFTLVIVGLSGMGVYMGRFLRWNSWDLVTQPGAILYDLAVRIRHPFGHKGTYAVALLFSVLLFACYFALTAGPTVSSDSPEKN
jgi:uncharacterized membrane protein